MTHHPAITLARKLGLAAACDPSRPGLSQADIIRRSGSRIVAARMGAGL